MHELEIIDPDAEGILGWQERALCAQTDPEAFFPEKGGSTRDAKRVCTGCQVRAECLVDNPIPARLPVKGGALRAVDGSATRGVATASGFREDLNGET